MQIEGALIRSEKSGQLHCMKPFSARIDPFVVTQSLILLIKFYLNILLPSSYYRKLSWFQSYYRSFPTNVSRSCCCQRKTLLLTQKLANLVFPILWLVNRYLQKHGIQRRILLLLFLKY
jgi:hypothetical protein